MTQSVIQYLEKKFGEMFAMTMSYNLIIIQVISFTVQNFSYQ